MEGQGTSDSVLEAVEQFVAAQSVFATTTADAVALLLRDVASLKRRVQELEARVA